MVRAIESGTYLLRSANNGMSAIINPTRSIEKKIEFGNSGNIELQDQIVIQETVFSE